MQKIRVDLGERSYNIHAGSGILSGLGEMLQRFDFSRSLAVVSNPTVYGIYGKALADTVRTGGFTLTEVLIPDGEGFKSLGSADRIYGELLASRLDRKSALIALGGGVIGDITGFVASTYMRGIDFVQVPTTLLAQVDSSVGGKTGVNHQLGKNMIGTFWQPRLVWIDIETLRTLPVKELRAGLAEVIKYGIIWDAELFAFLENNVDAILGLDAEAVTHIITRSCEIKADIVSKDERESGIRAILNCGHTIGHAIETATKYERYLHGEAVGIGMYLEARLAYQQGFLDLAQFDRIGKLLHAYGLESSLPQDIDPEAMMSAMQIDKKTVGGALVFVLPERIGTVRIERGTSPEAVRKALQHP